MSDKELIAAIEAYESTAETHGELSSERSKALDYYLGNPLGNEIDGRSQVVSRDVWDTVEWIKPQIADIFCGGDEVINFTPRGPEDVQAAEQETEFVNYVLTQKNNWFSVWYGWAHDALLQKVGYVKAYWDEGEDRQKEKYAGLTDDELTLLLQDKEIEPVEYEAIAAGGHNVTVERIQKYGCVKIVNVAPENVYVDSNSRNLNLQDASCNFTEHREQKTLSQLREQGFDIPDDISDAGTAGEEWEENRRDPTRLKDTENDLDPSMRKVTVRECWIRHDDDQDGKAELRHVIVVGTTVLLNEEATQSLLVALCPTPLPHKHTGLSVADAVKDLQLIKTALLRGSLDNLYLANNGRYAVDEDAVNLDDMLVSRPGGIVRVKGGMLQSGAIMPLAHTTTGAESVPMMEYIDRIGQKRTGINEQSQGIDPNVLQTATHSAQIATAAMQRIKFIARVFAETGVKALFQLVHQLTLTHSRQAEMIQLRNQWIPVDPRQWAKRADMQISVGLGAGDKMQQIVFLQGILEKQVLAMQAGLTSPPKIYNALKRLTQAGGFKDPNEFWDDPSTQPPRPQAPPPEVLAEQAKGQVAMQIEQLKGQTAFQIENQRSQLKMQELRANLALQASNDQRDAEREAMNAVHAAQLEKQKLQFQEWQAQITNQMTQYVTDANNATKLQIAGMQGEQKAESERFSAAADHHNAEKDRAHQEKLADKAGEQAKEQTKEKAKAEKPDPAIGEISKSVGELSKSVEAVITGQQKLEETIKKPKKLIRDEKGKVIGAAIGD